MAVPFPLGGFVVLRTLTLQMFTALRLLRAEWGGALVLGLGLRESGQALALASLGVGAAGLFLESDPTVLRAAQRSGCCTFVVTTLDEALRALKNEVRQRHAITVGLCGDTSRWLDEMIERGVLPALIGAESPVSISTFEGWGSQPMHGLGLARLAEVSLDLDAILNDATTDRWTLQEDAAASMLERRARDTALVAGYVAEDAITSSMRLWLGAAPSLFPRDTTRARWISAR